MFLAFPPPRICAREAQILLGAWSEDPTKRWLPALGATPSLLLRGAVSVWRNVAFRISWTHPLHLPDDLIALDSPTGLRLLAESAFVANYNSLSGNFESQSHPAFCGVASCVVVLNALRGSVWQSPPRSPARQPGDRMRRRRFLAYATAASTAYERAASSS
jgi:hypothetical protein